MFQHLLAYMRDRFLLSILLSIGFAALCWHENVIAAPTTVTLPLTVEYPLLRALLVDQAFPEEQEQATLADEGNGCILLTLAKPHLSPAGESMRLEIEVFARAGTPLGGACLGSLQWQGYLVLYQKPVISRDSWQLSFQTVSSELLGSDRQPAKIAGMLWNMIEPHTTAYLNTIRIDLMPPVADIKQFLLPLFPPDRRAMGQKTLDSMRPGLVDVRPDALRLPIYAEVDQVFDPSTEMAGTPLTQEERRQVVAVWEQWDGVLVYLITSLVDNALSEQEKQTLVRVLLDARYQFVSQMKDQTINRDIVRQQFVNAWRDLAPIFRSQLVQDADLSSAFGYLAFVSSADALLVFDQLGPTFGIEISTEGLVRILRMLNGTPDLLEYRQDINPQLQQLFDIDTEQATPKKNTDDRRNNQKGLLRHVPELFRPGLAWAAKTQPSFTEILQWRVPRNDVSAYIKRVHNLLQKTTKATIARKKLAPDVQSMFRLLIPAMAWQESCYRQFVVRNKQLTFLLSYNQSSVGIMQINERVWRGLYALNRLRWDIHYNAAAGSEIAAHYLTQYGLREAADRKQKLDDPTLARLVYAMYNGGPGQRNKFLKRLAQTKLYTSDKLFWEKYQAVSNGQVAQISRCLTGS